MTLKVNANILANAMKAAKKIVENRNTIPILSCVKLVAEKDTLTITTTNLDIEYVAVVEAFVKEPFAACMDAKRLSSMAAAAKGDMSMSLEKGILTIKAGRSRWAAPALPADGFPSMAADNMGDGLQVNLESIVRRVGHAASTEGTRYYLNGIFLNNEDGKARYVATDGARLASYQSADAWPEGAPDVIMPTGLCAVLADSGDGALSWDERKVRFVREGGNVTITGKTIDGSYPDYRRVIPSVHSVFQFDSEDALGAIKRVRIASDAKQRKLRIKPTGEGLELRIDGTSGFEGCEEIEAQCDGEHESAVNVDYLANMLDACGEGAVRVSQESANSPFRFDPIDDTSFVGVVMPMRF